MPRVNEHYYMDELERRVCEECLSEFIVGIQYTKQTGEPRCPYCFNKTHQCAMVVDVETLDSLGCGGLGWHVIKDVDDGKEYLVNVDAVFMGGAEKLQAFLKKGAK